ncbi:hypothetical protein OUZ56_018365 [Daphnia magna]|uniref:Uncharacterized protein n=1 Tax=Daphnia magna TaxID=35525 RepID=A0ABQ9Z996_9CRUS|nr:hypothetical protein OUZ56_018365 [Daphnia magna]
MNMKLQTLLIESRETESNGTADPICLTVLPLQSTPKPCVNETTVTSTSDGLDETEPTDPPTSFRHLAEKQFVPIEKSGDPVAIPFNPINISYSSTILCVDNTNVLLEPSILVGSQSQSLNKK